MNTRIQPSGVGRNATGSNRGGTPLLIHLCIVSDTVSRKSPCQSLRTSLKAVLVALVGALILCGVGASTASAAPVSLVLPQSTAFAILGHSCGGIQEKAYVTGFDAVSGYPTGDVQ